MGGSNLITFTVNGTEYQAEEGMTWGEFVNSEYNTVNEVGDVSFRDVGTIQYGMVYHDAVTPEGEEYWIEYIDVFKDKIGGAYILPHEYISGEINYII